MPWVWSQLKHSSLSFSVISLHKDKTKQCTTNKLMLIQVTEVLFSEYMWKSGGIESSLCNPGRPGTAEWSGFIGQSGGPAVDLQHSWRYNGSSRNYTSLLRRSFTWQQPIEHHLCLIAPAFISWILSTLLLLVPWFLTPCGFYHLMTSTDV